MSERMVRLRATTSSGPRTLVCDLVSAAQSILSGDFVPEEGETIPQAVYDFVAASNDPQKTFRRKNMRDPKPSDFGL